MTAVAPAGLRVDRYVLGQLARRADAEVLEAPDGRVLRGRAFLGATAGLAARLRDVGVGPGDRVVAVARTHPDVLACWLAANLLEAAFAPVAHVSTEAEIERAVACLRPAALLVDDETAPRAATSATPAIVTGTTPRADGLELPPSWPLRRELEPSIIRLSSGTTTGAPRPLVLSHRSVVLTLMGEALEIGASDRSDAVVALPLQGAGAWFSLALLAVGARVRLHPRPGRLAVEDLRGATHLVAVPEVLRRLAERPGSLDGLAIASTAAALAPPVADALAAKGARVHDLYGSTETEMLSSRRPGERCAFPFFNAEAGLDAAASDAPAPLRKRGPDVFSGIWSGTAPRTPLDASPSWVPSGDVGTLSGGGAVAVAGRADDVLVVRGNNVQPGEVEAVIGSAAGVEEVAVAASDRTGSLVAYVVAHDAAAVEHARALCAARLAPYKRPDQWVVVAALPRNQFGKLERRLLGNHMEEIER